MFTWKAPYSHTLGRGVCVVPKLIEQNAVNLVSKVVLELVDVVGNGGIVLKLPAVGEILDELLPIFGTGSFCRRYPDTEVGEGFVPGMG